MAESAAQSEAGEENAEKELAAAEKRVAELQERVAQQDEFVNIFEDMVLMLAQITNQVTDLVEALGSPQTVERDNTGKPVRIVREKE